MKTIKKSIALLLALVMVLTTVPVLVFAQGPEMPKLRPTKGDGELYLGDINGDGKVTATDARIILRISTKLEKAEDYQNAALVADVNGDDKITAVDARTVLRVATRLEAFENTVVSVEPETEEAATEELTNAESATAEVEVEESSIAEPTSEAPVTEAPSVEVPSEEAPSVEDSTSNATTTEASTTKAPVTESTTKAPVTESTTMAPVTEPTTKEPVTEEPTAELPTTVVHTTEAPTTDVSTTMSFPNIPTQAPTTEAPTTKAPTTEAPVTEEPTAEIPTTEAPTTEIPTTAVPTTAVPTTEPPTTAPTTEAPTTVEPTTAEPETTPFGLPEEIAAFYSGNYYLEGSYKHLDNQQIKTATKDGASEIWYNIDGMDMGLYLKDETQIFINYSKKVYTTLVDVQKLMESFGESFDIVGELNVADFIFGKSSIDSATSEKATIEGKEAIIWTVISSETTLYFTVIDGNVTKIESDDKSLSIDVTKLSADIPADLYISNSEQFKKQSVEEFVVSLVEV